MSDRLTQLQVCVDQLVEQFNAAVNYVNHKSEAALLDEDPNSVINKAANAPIPGQQQSSPQPDPQTVPTNGQLTAEQTSARNTGVNSRAEGSASGAARGAAEASFESTINELSTDIILKSRQISMLIDSLPGAGVSEDGQLEQIKKLAEELDAVEQERIKKIEEKDQFLQWCESLIMEVASGISKTKA